MPDSKHVNKAKGFAGKVFKAIFDAFYATRFAIGCVCVLATLWDKSMVFPSDLNALGWVCTFFWFLLWLYVGDKTDNGEWE